jgi:F-type H+-transporting ATPase subunit b
MELVTPGIGLIVWQTATFLILLFLLGKFAWKPVMKSIKERELSIETALVAAENARDEMKRLSNENDQLLKEARIERDKILKEAKELKDQIVQDAQKAAKVEGAKLIEKAKIEIEAQKAAAMHEVKSQVSTLSIEIAEKILRQQFADPAKQQALVGELIKEVKLN